MAELSQERRGEHVEVWTLQGEARRNALNRQVVKELTGAIEAAEAHRKLRAVVLTGQGDKAFCAGADLKERIGMSIPEVHAWLDSLRKMTTAIEGSRLPFIAAMNGSAYGGGLELALACDLRVGVEGSEMGLTEVTLAILPGAGGTQRLPRLIGVGRASELILTGARIPASEAYRMGILNRLVPHGGAVTSALEFAEGIAANGPVGVAAAKRALQEGLGHTLEAGLTIERREYEKTLSTKDRIEGLTAFQEKRRPIYRGE